ncbi:hypothetical protein PSMK_11380 [Phycisphaera mikurensis NBRC 102666]|uniref:Uncharacterized protein n=1 Tax=Phycisphaera mikurensis (strain NBRC 102666 / KCTC 22515 / FYK2301M01) TaxID=1142394 RepID=I0IDF9_PHYMF|nr:hypothetical protein PSMK_11380 [Phycisphaera mikurensis NBRC 102666]
MQRTGSARGFTLLSRFQLRRRSGRPLNTSSLGRIFERFRDIPPQAAGGAPGAHPVSDRQAQRDRPRRSNQIRPR